MTENKRSQRAKFKRINLSYANVLVVDDMPTNLDVAKGIFMPYKLNVDCASSGQQAVNLIRAENPRYNAVFMDHMMPGMDGIEAVRIIREELGTDYAKNVPIIALTANAITGNEEMFLQRGFQAFISKPIDMIRLDTLLRRWVRDKDREKELPVEDESGESEKTISSGENNGQSACAITIDGINIAKGMERFADNEEIYIKVLKSYAVNTRPLLGEIEKFLLSEDLPGYAVTIHGIKGSSYGIGAMRAGSEAERLEMLAKAGKKEQVLAENGAFAGNLEKLLDSIDSMLAENKRKNRKPFMAAPDPALLGELREACVVFDVERVDKAMSKLEAFEYESGEELVSWLHGQVEDMCFSEISNGDWPEASDFSAKTA